ncbi:MAG: phosphoribosylformylglycinamidine synthase, partial [Actinomycetota bacterium]
IKKPGRSRLALIDISGGKNRMGGSALAQALGGLGKDCPDVDDPIKLANTFKAIQELIGSGLILAGHDRSDGGLATTLVEMAMSGNCGIKIDLPPSGNSIITRLFSEEPGAVIEYEPCDEKEIIGVLSDHNISMTPLGETLEERKVMILSEGKTVIEKDTGVLLCWWEETSDKLEKHQMDPGLAMEQAGSHKRNNPEYRLSFTPAGTNEEFLKQKDKPRVAILREEGSNGDREMASAFHMAGFEAWDVAMTDLLSGIVTLDDFKGAVFVGGFSYADVLDSAKGWAGTIRFNPGLKSMFDKFYGRPDTFSLGVCNGCQLMALLGWVPWKGLEEVKQPRFIANPSGRLESRWVTVAVNSSPSIMLEGMEGSRLGVWVNHGEGFFNCPDAGTFKKIKRQGLVPVTFLDDTGSPTEKYPFNPNSSPEGISSLCSPDGRHLAMMPHPERTFLSWQWPWMPGDWKERLEASPWLKMFQNARKWCGGR